MKKSYVFLCFAVSFLLVISLAPKAKSAMDSFTTPGAQVQRELGFNPEDIPTSTADLKSRYLTQEWGKIVAGLPIIGPVFSFFANNPIIFKILINEQTEISFTFFLVLFMWITVFIATWRITRYIPMIKGAFVPLFALAFTLLLAHIYLFHFIASSISLFAFSYDAWWARTIIIAVACVLILVFGMLSQKIAAYLKDVKKERRLQNLESKAKIGEALSKGIAEGQKE